MIPILEKAILEGFLKNIKDGKVWIVRIKQNGLWEE